MTNVKFVSDGRDPDKCFSSFLAIKLVLCGVMVSVTFVSAYVSYFMSHTMGDEAFTIVMLFIAYYAISDLQTVMTYTMDGRSENGRSSLVFTIEFLVRGVLLIILALMQVDALVLSCAYLVGMVISTVACFWMFRHPRLRLRRPEYIREYVVFAAPIAISLLLVTAVDYMDKVIIGFSFGSREVGYYTAAAGIIWTFTNLGKSLNTVVLPHLSAYNRRDKNIIGAQGMVWNTERYLALLTFPVMAVMLVFGQDIATVLYGTGYARSGDVLSIQCFMLYAAVVSALMTQALYATNNARFYGRCAAMYVGLVIIMFFLLIPNTGAGLGAVGAGAALSIGYIFQAVVLAFYVRKLTGIRFYGRIWRHFAAAAVVVVAIATLDHFIGISGLLPLVGVSALSLLLHFGVCHVLGEFSRSDLSFFMDSLNIGKLKESLSEEFK